MSTQTSIEWTDVTWNPVRGCSLVSAGCANCYAMKQAHRFSGAGKPYDGLTELGPQGPRWTGKIQLVEEVLDAPLHWKKPRRIFVNSMSDLFHEDVPDAFIDRVFFTMFVARRHTYQILTKRPERMKAYLSSNETLKRFMVILSLFSMALPGSKLKVVEHEDGLDGIRMNNVWLGVSVEDQQTADERIPILLKTPAAVRWVSAEPLLGPVSFRWAKWDNWKDSQGNGRPVVDQHDGLRMLDWVVVGGESGPGARPCDVDWIRAIKNQCQAAGVPVFVKQLGSRPYAVEGSRAAQEWSALGASAVMDDCGGIHTKSRKGGDLWEWPIDLCVREWPR